MTDNSEKRTAQQAALLEEANHITPSTTTAAQEEQANRQFVKSYGAGRIIERFNLYKNILTTESISTVFKRSALYAETTEFLFDNAKEKLTADSLNHVFKNTYSSSLAEKIWDYSKNQISKKTIFNALYERKSLSHFKNVLTKCVREGLTSDDINNFFATSYDVRVLKFLFEIEEDKITSDSMRAAIPHLQSSAWYPITSRETVGFMKLLEQNILQRETQAIFGSNHTELAQQFKSLIQLSALKTLGIEKAELALKFTSEIQISALDILEGTDYQELAVEFVSRSQLATLRILGANEASLASTFVHAEQVKALEILGKDNAKLAQLFDTENKLRALSILGAPKANAALDFVYILNTILVEGCTTMDSVDGLYIRGSRKEIDAAIFWDTSRCKEYKKRVFEALEMLKDNEDINIALQFVQHPLQLKVLKILGPTRAELSLKIASSIPKEKDLWHDNILKALNILKDSADEYVSCALISGQNIIQQMLEFLVTPCYIPELAPLFHASAEIAALQILGSKNAVLALEIGRGITYTRFETYREQNLKHYEASACEKNALEALRVLKDTPNVRHSIEFFNVRESDMKLLASCINSDFKCSIFIYDNTHYSTLPPVCTEVAECNAFYNSQDSDLGLLKKCAQDKACHNNCIDNPLLSGDYHAFHDCYIHGGSSTNKG